MYSLIRKPTLFNARFCFSTPFWRQNNIMVSRVATNLAESDTLSSFVYMSAGGNETDNIRNGLSEMKKVFESKTVKGLTWHIEFTPDAIHQNNAKNSAPHALRLWSEYRYR